MLRRLFVILFIIVVLAASICGCTNASSNSTTVSSPNSITSSTSGSTVTPQKNTSVSRPSSEPSDSVSTGKKDALESAKQYLNAMAFSYSGLIDQLEFEGYSTDEATYAADNCGANWKEQAVLAAMQYLDTMDFSKDGLIDQLEYEGFTFVQRALIHSTAIVDYRDLCDLVCSLLLSGLPCLPNSYHHVDMCSFRFDGIVHNLTQPILSGVIIVA